MQNLNAILLAATLLMANVAKGQSNLVLLISEPGDYIGQGQTDVTTNLADFSVAYDNWGIDVGAFGYDIWADGPNGAPLRVGTYTNAARDPFNGSAPGLSIFGNGRGCNTLCGSFQIFELGLDGSGNITHLWMTFTQYCECESTFLTGEIRYLSQLAPPAPAPKTIHVPADYPTIQAAIGAASVLTADTILVSAGTYNEAIDFDGKGLLLTSAGGPAVTIISPPSDEYAVTFNSGETSNSIITGFTITNATPGSSGIYVGGSSPTIVSNRILGCAVGVYGSFGSPSVIGNVIADCYQDAAYLGGAGNAFFEGNLIESNAYGIDMFAAGAPVVMNNTIQGNEGDAMGGVNQCDINIIQNVIANNAGYAITIHVSAGDRGPVCVNNTIVNNGQGISFSGAGSAAINNVVVGNAAVDYSYIPLVENNDFFSPVGNAYADGESSLAGTNGNISAAPLFACAPSGDFRLLAGSLVIDAGSNGAPELPALDFNGNPRILAGINNGPAIVDMGAFEFSPASPPVPCLYLIAPSNVVVVAAPGQDSALAYFPAPDATPTAIVSCVPASGSVFPAGTNIILCTLIYGTNTLTATFTVTVEVPPYITNQPSIVSVLANSNATMTVGALGTAPLSYQWSFNGTAIDNATNSTLTVPGAQSVNEGYYQVTLANNVGTATSLPIILLVVPSAAVIVSGPVSQSVPAGNHAVFTARVIGSAPLAFQWYKDGALLAGANSSQLVISNAQAADDGTYQLQVSNLLATALSAGATLTVLPVQPSFALQPVSMAAVAGAHVAFESLAVGSEDALDPITYAWYFQSNRIPSQTSSNLSLAAITATNQGAYYVVAANAYGSATSAVAQLTVYLPPSWQTGLSNLVEDQGQSIMLSASATGTPPLAYSWNFNWTQLSNTASFLSLTNIRSVQSGYYSVTVTNVYGSISSTSRVSVFSPPSQIVAWGDDSNGQTNVPGNLDNAVAMAGGDYHSVAVRHDGTLVAWGEDDYGQIDVPNNSWPFVSVAAGADHSLAIIGNGSVIAWGLDDSGQTNVPVTVSSALSVAAGESHSLALLAMGTVVAWGDDTYGQTNIPDALELSYYIDTWWGEYEVTNPDWIPVQSIAAGRNHNLALLTNGTVVAWGDNGFGQSTPPSNLSNVVAIAAGYLHSAALSSNGTVVVWGDDTFGETNVPPGLSNVVAIAAGDFHTLALLSNGAIVGWGDNAYGQLNVPSSAADASGIASGYYHGMARVPNLPWLYHELTPAGLVLQWYASGTLQSAPTLLGPFTDVPTQGYSYTNVDMSAPAKFFRLRR